MTDQSPVVALHYLTDAIALPRFFRIGRETHDPGDVYDWDCRARNDPHCLFAYTESGLGELQIDDAWYTLRPGHAFLIEVPGPFHYRRPNSSVGWTLKYIAVSLDALSLWAPITERTGRIIQLAPNSGVIDLFDLCWQKAQTNAIRDVYENSVLLYRFMMELLRLSELEYEPLTGPVRTCQNLMDDHPEQPWSLQTLTETTGLSSYHLIRLFRSQTGETPIRYLLRTRIRMAVRLLVETDDSIAAIATRTGFDNANYFSKAFRHWMNLSPSQLREQARLQGVDCVHVR